MKQAYGSCPANPLFPTVPTMPSNGGGDSNPGYDVILMKKGMMDIQQEARDHLAQLDYENPEDLDKIYFYKSVIETTEGVMAYARRMSRVRGGAGSKGKQIRRERQSC